MAIKNITKEEDFFNRIKEFKIKIIPMNDKQKEECIEEWNSFVVEYRDLDKSNYYYREIAIIMEQLENKFINKQEEAVSIKNDNVPIIEEGPKNLFKKAPEIEKFYSYLIGILTWINENKAQNPNFIYDNIKEFNELVVKFNALNVNDHDCIDIMRILEKDINLTIQQKNIGSDVEERSNLVFKNTSPGINEVKKILDNLNKSNDNDNNVNRSPEVEDFYNKLMKIRLHIQDNKKIDPNYLWDNVDEFNKLFIKFNELRIDDQECIDIMHYLEQDINVVLTKNNIPSVIELPPISNELSPTEIYKNKISGIISWLNEEKNNNPEFRYDNEQELIELLKEAGRLNIIDPIILDMLIYLSEDSHGDIIEQQQNGFDWMKL